MPVEKPVKMEEVGQRIEGILLPLFPELDDSGIDSDSTELIASSARLLQERNGLFSDASSSDEEYNALRMPYPPPNNNWMDEGARIARERRQMRGELKWPEGPGMLSKSQAFDNLPVPDRSSPPLYEVELTASDEDDDTSVLELVIPMQPRYMRVPTASPKKEKPKSKPKANRTFYYSFICCMRK